MCSQNVSVAEAADDGIATCWYSESVCVVPYPSSQAFHEPEWAGSTDELSRTPAVATHGAAVPVSNPGLPSSCDPPPPAAWTASDTVVERVTPPPEPVTVTVYEPAAVDDPTVTVMVD